VCHARWVVHRTDSAAAAVSGSGPTRVDDDRWAPLVSDSGRGRRRRGLAAVAGPAGPSVLRRAGPRSVLLGCRMKGSWQRPAAAAGLLRGLAVLHRLGCCGLLGWMVEG
jgi:hypothetical protein